MRRAAIGAPLPSPRTSTVAIGQLLNEQARCQQCILALCTREVVPRSSHASGIHARAGGLARRARAYPGVGAVGLGALGAERAAGLGRLGQIPDPLALLYDELPARARPRRALPNAVVEVLAGYNIEATAQDATAGLSGHQKGGCGMMTQTTKLCVC